MRRDDILCAGDQDRSRSWAHFSELGQSGTDVSPENARWHLVYVARYQEWVGGVQEGTHLNAQKGKL